MAKRKQPNRTQKKALRVLHVRGINADLIDSLRSEAAENGRTMRGQMIAILADRYRQPPSIPVRQPS